MNNKYCTNKDGETSITLSVAELVVIYLNMKR